MKILLMYSNHRPSPEHIERLQSKAPDITVVVADSEWRAIEEAPSTDVIFGHRYLRQTLPHAPRVRWIQSSGGGIDHIICSELLNPHILLTRTPVFAHIIARHAHTLAWSLIRRIPDFVRLQFEKTWNPFFETLPFPKAALVLGFGCIGRELGKLLKRDSIRVLGVKRCLEKDSRMFCDELLGENSWRERLHDVDFCFLTLPLNIKTMGIFDEYCLRSLPPHAVMVNVGRGELMDTQALIRVLHEGHLGGVGLDVVDPQPPSPADPIWKAPRLCLTPHVAGRYPQRSEVLENFFEQQLSRFLTGEPLEGVINPSDLLLHENIR